MAYVFARSATYAGESTKMYHNEKTGHYDVKERLFVDKVGRVACYTAVAPFAWGVFVWEDLATLECLAKGKDPREYKAV
jgi:hypothetical protein